MFFVTLYGKNTDSALPLLNFLDCIFRLLQFSHQWHQNQLPSIFDNYFRYASDVHTDTTLDMLQKVTAIKHASGLILPGKRTLSALAADHWQKLPHDIKDLNFSIFLRRAKQYLLRKQMYYLGLYNSSIFYFSQ